MSFYWLLVQFMQFCQFNHNIFAKLQLQNTQVQNWLKGLCRQKVRSMPTKQRLFQSRFLKKQQGTNRFDRFYRLIGFGVTQRILYPTGPSIKESRLPFSLTLSETAFPTRQQVDNDIPTSSYGIWHFLSISLATGRPFDSMTASCSYKSVTWIETLLPPLKW